MKTPLNNPTAPIRMTLAEWSALGDNQCHYSESEFGEVTRHLGSYNRPSQGEVFITDMEPTCPTCQQPMEYDATFRPVRGHNNGLRSWVGAWVCCECQQVAEGEQEVKQQQATAA